MVLKWKTYRIMVVASLSMLAVAQLFGMQLAHAVNPQTMSFQGKVVNANGTNVTDGTYPFVFKLYTVGTGGTAMWTETQSSVTVSGGIFQVNLASSCPFFTTNACNNNTIVDFNANPSMYLGITFNNDAAGEMTPRVQLQSVPFAFNADKVGGRSVGELVQLTPGSQQTGTVNVSGLGTFGGLTVNGTAIISANQNVTLQSGTGVLSQTFSNSTTSSAQVLSVTNANAGVSAVTVTAYSLTLVGTATSGGINTNIGMMFQNPTAVTNNVYYGLDFSGTGYTDVLRVNNVQIVSGVGKIQDAAFDSTLSYASLVKVGALSSGSLTTGFGTINIASAITTSLTAGNALAVTGAPTNTATTSLVRLGNAIASGNVASNGGTYLGINLPSTGAGSVADFVNLQANGVSKFKIDSTGVADAATRYSVAGSASLTLSCGNGQYLNTPVVSGGIMVSSSGCGTVTLSDQRLKNNVVSLGDSVLDQIKNVNTVTFDFDCNNNYFAISHTSCDARHQTGVIAQQLAQVFPELVSQDEYGYFNVNYLGLSIYNLKAVSQIAQHIDSAGNAAFNNLQVKGNLAYGTTTTDTGKFTTGVISPQLVSEGSLQINSGATGSISLDTNSADGFIRVGSSQAGAVRIGNAAGLTSIDSALVLDKGSTSKGNVAMYFKGSEGLHLFSDLSGNGTGFSFEATPSTQPGNTTGVAIKQSESLNPNGLDTAIMVDNANSKLQITSALTFDNSGGAGYKNLISSKDFQVSGNGDLSTNGSATASSFIIKDASGSQTMVIDASGNATLAKLDLSDANLRGNLTVTGNSNFAGLSTFQKLATFLGTVIFRQDVTFDGHVTVSRDGAGYAMLQPGESSVHINFTKPYTTAPIVNATLIGNASARYGVDNVSERGFDLILQTPSSQVVTAAWTAIAVTDPFTSVNPATTLP